MNRKGFVYIHGKLAGTISETDDGYTFAYDTEYLAGKKCVPVSLTLPIREDPYHSKTMFPFFDGLIPEGWLLDIAEKHWKINIRDRMGLLLACCNNCIGAVSVRSDKVK